FSFRTSRWPRSNRRASRTQASFIKARRLSSRAPSHWPRGGRKSASKTSTKSSCWETTSHLPRLSDRRLPNEAQAGRVLLRARSAAAGAAGDRLAHWHRAGGGEKAELKKLRLERPKVVKAVGIDPNRHRRALRLEGGNAAAKFRARSERLRDRLAEIRLNIDEINQLQLHAAVAGG